MSIYLRGVFALATSLTAHRAIAPLVIFAILNGCPMVTETAVLAETAAGAETALTTLRHETRQLLRQEAVLDEGNAKDDAITALCDLYVVIRNDDRYDTSEMLQGDAAKIRRRLLSIAHQREHRLTRQGIIKPDSLSSEVESAVQSALADPGSLRRRLDKGAQAGGAAADNGWQLVELIQRVVAPDFWEQTGGPGTIRYFAMRRVLVVRATTDVHEQIKDLLMALR